MSFYLYVSVVEFVPGTSKYMPVLYFNDYWNLNTEYQPINDTTK